MKSTTDNRYGGCSSLALTDGDTAPAPSAAAAAAIPGLRASQDGANVAHGLAVSMSKASSALSLMAKK